VTLRYNLMRAFIAIDMPAFVLQQLTATQRKLARLLQSRQLDRCVRWTSAGNLHLTLRFLGEIDEVQCGALLQTLPLIAARFPPLVLRSEGLGCFPNLARPTVIWSGLQGDMGALARVQADVEASVRSLDIAPEAKHFKPHLTIGRTQRSATGSQLCAVGDLVAQLAAMRDPAPTSEPPPIGELLLYQSKLTPSGPIYTRLGVFPLTGG